jgi:hypothetical protein
MLFHLLLRYRQRSISRHLRPGQATRGPRYARPPKKRAKYAERPTLRGIAIRSLAHRRDTAWAILEENMEVARQYVEAFDAGIDTVARFRDPKINWRQSRGATQRSSCALRRF